MDELVKRLREEASEWCTNCCYRCGDNVCGAPDDRKKDCDIASKLQAADAIEELLKAAKAMHTWIFLNSLDEQAAYDECGLTDEMNAALGYGGQLVVELPKEET